MPNSTSLLMHWRKLPATALLTDTALQRQWDQLNAERLDLPFLSAAAIGAALQVFGDGTERLLVASDRDGSPAAMALLQSDGALRWRSFQPSQLPLGAWVAGPAITPVMLTRSLLRGPLGLCLVLSLTQTDTLTAAREPDAPDTTHGDYIDTAWVDIEGSFDDYWAARGKNLRQNMRKQRNKLAAAGTSTVMRVWRDAADMASALQRYGAIESIGWKAARGTAIHADNDQGRFYLRMFEHAARHGEAVIFEYLFDDRPVAMNLCLLRGGVLVVLKTTYDESIPSSLSPAFLLREAELQHFFAADSGIKRVEYYGRVMDWHTKLTDKQRGIYHLTGYRWPVVKSLAARRRAAAPAAAIAAGPAGAAAADAPAGAEAEVDATSAP